VYYCRLIYKPCLHKHAHFFISTAMLWNFSASLEISLFYQAVYQYLLDNPVSGLSFVPTVIAALYPSNTYNSLCQQFAVLFIRSYCSLSTTVSQTSFGHQFFDDSHSLNGIQNVIIDLIVSRCFTDGLLLCFILLHISNGLVSASLVGHVLYSADLMSVTCTLHYYLMVHRYIYSRYSLVFPMLYQLYHSLLSQTLFSHISTNSLTIPTVPKPA